MFSQCVAPKSSCIDEIIMCTDGTKVSTIVDKMSTQAKLITDDTTYPRLFVRAPWVRPGGAVCVWGGRGGVLRARPFPRREGGGGLSDGQIYPVDTSGIPCILEYALHSTSPKTATTGARWCTIPCRPAAPCASHASLVCRRLHRRVGSRAAALGRFHWAHPVALQPC